MLYAEEMIVPVKLQLALFFKILSYDRNLKARVGNEIVIGIVYERDFRKSLRVKEELVNLLNNASAKKLQGIPIQYVSIEISDKTDLTSIISQNHVDILYISPVHGAAIRKIRAASRAKQILTLTGVPDYVESGVAVGIGIKGSKPLIIINLPASKAQGADFTSQLLKLAKVIK